MVRRHKKRYTKKNLAAAVVLSCLLSTSQALGAELAAVVPSDFHNSQVGTLSGSRVTAYIDPASATMKIDELNRDPSVFTINHNGKSQVLLRQYTYSTTDLKAINIINPVSANWTDYVSTGEMKSVPNIHAAATYGDFLYTTDYDLGNIAIAGLGKATLSEGEHYSLKEDAAKVTGIAYDDKATFHGEGLVIKDNYLYAITSVNLDGGYDNYDNGYLLQYEIKKDGSLVAVDAQRIGKNTFNIHAFNDTLFTCSSGGYQQMGFPNEETAIHAVNINNGSLAASRKLSIPPGVKGEYRDMAITNDGTAYVFGGYYDASYGGIIGNVYKTTVTNLLADKPVAWEKVIEINDWPGFNWDIEVESNPRRLWFLAGNKLQIYQDGSTKPLEFAAADFATKAGLNQFNSWGLAFITPDTVAAGNSKTVTLQVGEGLTSPAATIAKTILLPAADAAANGTNGISGAPDYTTRIMGLQQYNNGTGLEYTDTEYLTKDITTDFQNYRFSQDTMLGLSPGAAGDYKTNILAAVFARYGQDITVDAGRHALTLNVENHAGNPTGIYAGNGKNVTLNAGQLNINTATYANGEMVTNAIWNDAAKDMASTITVNAPVHITMAGGQGGNGIAVDKKDRWGEASAEATAKSKIIINGDVTIAGTDGSWGVPLHAKNVYSRFNSAGLYTSVNNSEIDVNGKVDLTVYGNGIATVAQDSKITVDGGHIAVPAGKNYGYYTLAAYLGTINMNTGDAGNLPGTEDVRLDGDIFTLTTGAVNVGLTTANSYLKGLVDNGGAVTMWLQNGATWTDKAQNTRYADDNEDIGANGASRITSLYGGGSSDSRGVIFPENDKGITIDNYTGNLLAIYEHDPSDPVQIKGGGITITAAAQTNGQNAVMTLRTDNAGINTADTAVVSNVLNALAGKLTYTNYKNGERYLDGKVEIAEGLTAQSAAQYTGAIAFDGASGQGSYSGGTAPEPPGPKTEFTSAITGGTDKEYAEAGVKDGSRYTFAKDTVITVSNNAIQAGYKADFAVDAKGHTLTAVVNGTNAINGINLNGSQANVSVEADKLIIRVSNDSKGFIDKTYGIWQSGDQGRFSVSGLTEISTSTGGLSYGVYATRGEVQLAGAHVTTDEQAADSRSLLAEGDSRIAVNVKDGQAGASEVQIKGNMYTTAATSDYSSKTAVIDLALTTDQSFFRGLSAYQYADNSDEWETDIRDHGTVNLWLQNGAVWTNEQYGQTAAMTGFTGSYVTKLAGGTAAEHSGIIYQQDNRSLHIDQYSGHATVLYHHDADSPATILGGAVKIGRADAGSAITLRTDYDDRMNTDGVQKNVLQALAQKLYYQAYTGGEQNLTGTVEIAEGLTAQSAAKYTGAVAFDGASGQGSYSGGTVPEPPAEQTTTEFTATLTGVTGQDSEYTAGGVLKDNAYAFTKDSTITVDDGDATADSIGYYQAVAGILGSGNDITVNGADRTLAITAANTDSANQAIGLYSNRNLNLTAQDLRIASTSAGQTANGIFLHDGGQADITGNVHIQARHTGDGSATGIYLYNNGAKLTIHGDLTMKGNGTGDDAYGILSAKKGGYGTPSWQAKGISIYDTTGAELLVTGSTDIAVKGTGVDMRGSKNNRVTLGGGSIITPASTADTFKALSIAAGTFNMGMNDNGTDANGKDVTVTGEIYVLENGAVNLGLGSAGSAFTGVADNSSGTVNLYLKNGGTWTNQATANLPVFDGSRINRLTGGSFSDSRQGYIYQQDSRDITIDQYSGYTSIWYDHEAANPLAIKGGAIRITSAAPGSQITLRTDNGGLNTASTAAADKNKVSDTLNALANKLYYTSHQTEGQLTGKVEIAEGLTAQSASRTETITYQEGGQGQYEFTPAVDAPEAGPVTKSTVLTEDRLAEATEKNVQGPTSSLLVSALYSEANTARNNPMVVDLNGYNLTLATGGDEAILASLYTGTNQYIDIKNDQADKKLIIHAAHNNDTRAANGIYVSGNAHLSIAGPVEIDGIYTKGDSVAGINIQGAGSAGGGAGSEVIINGPLTIKNITAERGRGNGINAAGIRVTADAAKVIVNDTVDITGIKGSGLHTVGADTEISIGGGIIAAAADTEHAKQYYAVRADKGTVNINMDGDKAGTRTAQLTGDLYVTREYGQKVVEYSGGQLIDFDNKGVLNVALTDQDSFWTGAATYVADRSDYGTGGFTARDAGTFNLYLQNGAVWTNEVQSGTSDQLNTFQGSHLARLAGGAAAGGQGYIYQQDSRDITIDQYSGYTSIWYDHEAANPLAIKGGAIRITSAEEGAQITLRTDNGGLNTASTAAADKNKVSDTLNALANKLYYTGHLTEGQLTGKVEIAEGLTAQSASRTETITYNEDGQGRYAFTPAVDIPDEQNKTEFTTAITGMPAADTEYIEAGVLKDGRYVFTKESTAITTGKHLIAGGPWLGQLSAAIAGSTGTGSPVHMDLNGQALTVGTTTDTSTTGIAAIGNEGRVELHDAGAVTVRAESTKGGQAAALFVNGGGEIAIHNGGDNADQKILTLRADTTTKANGAVVKSMNGAAGVESKITIDGLVDVLADGDMSDGQGANEAVSAVASTIQIGGGTIRAVNGAAWAIRAYGEFVSQNTGTVAVNVVKDSGGNITGAGNNRTVIEGDFSTAGGMGTKGLINIGLGTADSSWTGNYTTSGGQVNVFMKDGASWTGYNTGTNFALNMQSGALWRNTGKSTISSLTGSTGGSNASIDMTAGSAGDVTIGSYSGNTLALYAHNADNPADILGGSITVTAAETQNGANAVMTLRTDNTGINTADEDAVTAVLTALAGKLTYTNYTQGERNLTGYVQIAEGLTAQSAARQTGDIAFSDTDGTGSLKEDSLQPGYTYPDEQSKETFTSAITGNGQTDKEYQRNGVLQASGIYKFTKPQTAITLEAAGEAAIVAKDNAIAVEMGKNKLIINNSYAAADTTVSGMAADQGHNIVVDNAGAITVTAHNSDGGAAGLYANGASSRITINNDNGAANALTVTGSAKDNQYAGIKAADGGSITVNGLVAITANEAISADSGFIAIGGGTLASGQGTAIRAAGSSLVSINVTGSGEDLQTAGNTVVINGDISLQNNALLKAPAATGAGTVNLGLSGPASAWTGAADQQNGIINLLLAKGATWTNQTANSSLTGSSISKLVGGDSDGNRGVIIQKDNNNLTIGSYSGYTLAVYGHEAGDPAKIIGGAITIGAAEKTNGNNAGITLRVDNGGIDTTDRAAVENVLAALANKLNYTNYTEQKLNGSVEIAEGLTAAGVAKRGTILFADSSSGSLQEGSIVTPGQSTDPEIVYGAKETAMMRGAKTAMTSSILAWRTENSDLGERLGDLRKTAADDGIWARVYGGENKYGKDNTHYSNNFKTVQIGYDRPAGNSGWQVGGAVSYMDGDSKYELGGRGDNEAYSLALYGTWLGGGGQYLDLVMKGSKLKNDYTVYNDMGHKLQGDYDNWGTSLSVEYGRKINRNNGFYVEPQAQLTYARLNSAGYNAHSDFGGGKDMRVEQGSMNSLIGRLGIGIGRELSHGRLYAKAALAHEFCGNMTTVFAAVNEPTSSVSQDFGDTWWEFNVGGSRMLSSNTYLYADVTKTVGGDIDVNWKANAGLRWLF